MGGGGYNEIPEKRENPPTCKLRACSQSELEFENIFQLLENKILPLYI